MKNDARNRRDPLTIRWLGAAPGAVIALALFGARAQSAEPSVSLPALAPPSNGPLNFNPSPAVESWLDMVSATQAAQPNWMTPLVTVTPRLEQELRADFYDQQNGTGSQGNGQRIVNYGGPGGFRVEFIPAWNVEVIVAVPPYETATGPKGAAQGWGDWPAFLVKYRIASGNAENGDYIVTAFLQDDRRRWERLEKFQTDVLHPHSRRLARRQGLGRFRYSDRRYQRSRYPVCRAPFTGQHRRTK